MALELLRLQILERGQTSFCTNIQVSAQDASSVLLGLQMLVRVKGKKDEKLLLSDPLFLNIFSSSTMHIDTIFSLCQCFLKYIHHEKQWVDLNIIRSTFKVREPKEPPTTPVECAPNVELLARNPLARATVCGWETDPWFFNQQGQLFVKFWTNTHPSTCITLPNDEQITAVLYYGLQSIFQICSDTLEQFHVSFSNCQTVHEKKQIFQQYLLNLENEDNLIQITEFLALPLEKFADAFQIGLEITWNAAEDIYIASNGILIVEEFQNALAEASSYRNKFIVSARRLKNIAKCLLEWLKTQAEFSRIEKKESNIDSFSLLDLLVKEMNTVLDLFGLLNKSVGSLPAVVFSFAQEYRGLIYRVNGFVKNLQKSFRGICLEKSKNMDYQVDIISLPSELQNIQTWEELERYIKDTRKQSRGAGIAFVLNKRVLLPLSPTKEGIDDKWIGGRVEPNEHWYDAAWREFDEETFVRVDPWVDEFKTTSEKNCRKIYLDDEKQYGWMSLEELESKKHGNKAFLIAIHNGIQIERHVKCNERYSKRRMSTRDVLCQAFDSSSVDKKQEFLQKFRIICESSANGRKTYQTIVMDLQPIIMQPRITSIVKIPTVFSIYATQISECCKPCFKDVFAAEPLNINFNSMNNNEHPSFEWVKFDDERSIRIRKAINMYKQSLN